MTSGQQSVVSLPDGRQLGYTVFGDPNGLPVLCLHGTPGSTRRLAFLDGPASARGIALIAPERAGYGESTYDPRFQISSRHKSVS